jgi:LmbE family N-acetylglucosaminyl deacetylase
MPLTIVHLAPHPDDEAIGAVGTLLTLRRHGHRVINVVCSEGRPDQRSRRRAEAAEACRRARFVPVFLDPPVGLSSDDDLELGERRLTAEVGSLIRSGVVDLLVSPSPHDGHHGHEVVGRAARAVVRQTGVRWWMWGLWADLPLPTLYSAFDRPTLWRALRVLRAHKGELERNDYVRLVRHRAAANQVVGPERIFGWGSPMASRRPYAELLTEAAASPDGWLAGAPRVLDPAQPLAPMPDDRPLEWWLDARSLTDCARDAPYPRCSFRANERGR